MAGPRPDSVVVSLGELRRIEAQRQDGERRAEERRRVEEQQRREEAERAAAAEHAACERAELERAERRRFDEQMRLAEAERRARVEAELALERQRVSMEMAARRPPPSRVWAVTMALALALAASVAALGIAWQRASNRATALATELAANRSHPAGAHDATGRHLHTVDKELAMRDAQLQATRRRLEVSLTEAEALRAAKAKALRDLAACAKKKSRPAPDSVIDVDACHDSKNPLCEPQRKVRRRQK